MTNTARRLVRVDALDSILAFRVWLACGHSLLTRRLGVGYRCNTCAAVAR